MVLNVDSLDEILTLIVHANVEGGGINITLSGQIVSEIKIWTYGLVSSNQRSICIVIIYTNEINIKQILIRIIYDLQATASISCIYAMHALKYVCVAY